MAGFAGDPQFTDFCIELTRLGVPARVAMHTVALNALAVPVTEHAARIGRPEEHIFDRKPALLPDVEFPGNLSQTTVLPTDPIGLQMVRPRGHHDFSVNGRRIGNALQSDAATLLFQFPIRVGHFYPERVAASVDRGCSSSSGQANWHIEFWNHGRGCGDLRHRTMIRGVPTVVLRLVAFTAGGRGREPFVFRLSRYGSHRSLSIAGNTV